jgi:hypothetical protein
MSEYEAPNEASQVALKLDPAFAIGATLFKLSLALDADTRQPLRDTRRGLL